MALATNELVGGIADMATGDSIEALKVYQRPLYLEITYVDLSGMEKLKVTTGLIQVVGTEINVLTSRRELPFRICDSVGDESA